MVASRKFVRKTHLYKRSTFCCVSEKDILLAWLFKHHLTEQSMKDAIDVNGNTAVHALVKSTVEDTKLKQRVLKYLLENGCSLGFCDVDGKLPKDCITTDDPCFQILVSSAFHIGNYHKITYV